jgi:hypothetical protein
MCHKIGIPPIVINGFGLLSVSSENLVPKPPAKITHFIYLTKLNLFKIVEKHL